ncbi:Ger(x)C family germination protein [Bacillus ectoiniformans]|uniref:Ger(x)C family spore germination protein n=1 Tax=Bacillus ectoiniformans TaxID=1494429 RepID=UPI00195765F5|nr:Ger(x)C family spore germination protein [Bacillus ectoiniformans]MBM7649753.1 Ger(x)C family germination protein [Bacillus ectoiniformans]
MRTCIKRKQLLYTILLIFTLLLAGCWDTNEPERMVYIHGLGVDYNKGRYTIYLQIINTGLLAKSESGGGENQAKVEVGKASGKNINEAIFNLYRSSQRKIFWGHLGYVVFTESALKEGAIRSTIDLLNRYRETRYRMWMYATKEPLFELLSTSPIMELSTALSRLSDPYSTYQQSSFIQPVDMRELLILLDEPPYQAIIPYMKLTEDNWTKDGQVRKAIKTEGIAAVTSDKLLAVMTEKKVNGLKWLNNDLVREEVKLIKEGYEDINMLIDKLNVEVKPFSRKGKVYFSISIEADAVLREMPEKKSIKEIAKVLEQTMEKQVREAYLAGLKNNTDIYRLSESLYRKDVQLWKSIEQKGKIPLTKDSLQQIDINATIINGAKQRKEPTLY